MCGCGLSKEIKFMSPKEFQGKLKLSMSKEVILQTQREFDGYLECLALQLAEPIEAVRQKYLESEDAKHHFNDSVNHRLELIVKRILPLGCNNKRELIKSLQNKSVDELSDLSESFQFERIDDFLKVLHTINSLEE